jgi:hypothetical protein
MGGNVVRFTVSRVMDMIEQRLTTEVALAQAVVDVGAVARFADLDHGRPISVLRLGMVIDALARYLVDAGAMLYPVAGRELLSESALTSKERMALTRWADDGLIEVTPAVDDRVVEIADLTGLPLIVVSSYDQYASRVGWLRGEPQRSLWLRPRSGAAVLVPGWAATGDEVAPVAVGRARVPNPASQEVAPLASGEDAAETAAETAERATARDVVAVREAVTRLDAASAFLAKGAIRMSSTRVVAQRFTRAEPSANGRAVLAREWRCLEHECPAFGGYRTIGQPMPRMRDGQPICPRHGTPLANIGPRPPSYPVAVVVDDLPRRRFVVDPNHPVAVGRAPSEPGDVSVAQWLHSPAAAWTAPSHLRLTVDNGALVVTDTSENGTVIWRRGNGGDPGTTERIRGCSQRLGEWDSIELYTGVELVVGNWYHTTVVGAGEVDSVMTHAPTVVLSRSEISA